MPLMSLLLHVLLSAVVRVLLDDYCSLRFDMLSHTSGHLSNMLLNLLSFVVSWVRSEVRSAVARMDNLWPLLVIAVYLVFALVSVGSLAETRGRIY
jgi:steroid 5-alpha reductase family enzyme